MRRTSSGIRLTRTPRQVRQAAEDRVAVTVLGPGRWRFTQGEVDQVVESSGWETILVDHSTPYEFVRPQDGTTFAFGIDHDDLGLPVDAVRRSVGRVTGSPLQPVLGQHLVNVERALAGLGPGPERSMIGAATADLARALILSVLDDRPPAGAPTPDSLLVRSRLYVRAHAADRDLTPARIARAHHVSVRRLYGAWSQAEVSLAGYLMARRLELAREALSRPESRLRTIASIARDCGFVDPAHFSRRFGAAFGRSPRDWRAGNQP